jgi:hypothetical protein
MQQNIWRGDNPWIQQKLLNDSNSNGLPKKCSKCTCIINMFTSMEIQDISQKRRQKYTSSITDTFNPMESAESKQQPESQKDPQQALHGAGGREGNQKSQGSGATLPWNAFQKHPGSQFILHSPFTIRHSPFAIRHSPFAIHHSPFTIHHSPFTIHHSPFAICHLPFAICHLPFAICHLPFGILQYDNTTYAVHPGSFRFHSARNPGFHFNQTTT